MKAFFFVLFFYTSSLFLALQSTMIPQTQIEAVMDYEQMSKFITWVAFRMLKQPHNPSINFEKLLNLLLYATRLSKTTILVAIEYLNQRFSHLEVPFMDEGEVFTLLVVSMMLANKSQDDATFTARSWSQASGIRLETLNEYERKWLEAIKWDLFINKFLENIEILEKCWYTYMQNGYNVTSPTSTSINVGTVSHTHAHTNSHSYTHAATPTSVAASATMATGVAAATASMSQYNNYNYGYNEPAYQSSYSYYPQSYSYYPQSYNYYYSQPTQQGPVPSAPSVPSLYYDPVVILVFP